MTQRGERLGLALEPLLQIRVRGDVLGEDLDGDGAVQARVGRFVDLAHAPRANGGSNRVGTEPRARGQGHLCGAFYGSKWVARRFSGVRPYR